tara:strand:+ start:65 stop:553 length:489 start_codon:yes stop_codon:yes gene_type:complete
MAEVPAEWTYEWVHNQIAEAGSFDVLGDALWPKFSQHATFCTKTEFVCKLRELPHHDASTPPTAIDLMFLLLQHSDLTRIETRVWARSVCNEVDGYQLSQDEELKLAKFIDDIADAENEEKTVPMPMDDDDSSDDGMHAASAPAPDSDVDGRVVAMRLHGRR